MKVHDLQNFCEVCRCKSFTKAAQNLYMSRQSVLRSINSLEDQLRYPLFSRGPLGVTLTEFGQLFYKKVSLVLNDIDALTHLPEEFDRGVNRRIGIGIRGNFRSAYIVRTLIRKFQEIYPDTDVEVIGCETNDILPRVQEDRIDIGFTILPDETDGLKKLPLEMLEFAVLTHKDSSLANFRKIHVEQLAGETFISAAFSRHPIRIISDFSAKVNDKPVVLMDTVDVGLLYQMVHNNAAHGILLRRDAHMGMRVYDDVICRSFEPPLCLCMGLLYKDGPNMTRLKRQFIDYAARNYDKVRAELCTDSIL